MTAVVLDYMGIVMVRVLKWLLCNKRMRKTAVKVRDRMMESGDSDNTSSSLLSLDAFVTEVVGLRFSPLKGTQVYTHLEIMYNDYIKSKVNKFIEIKK